MLCDLCLVDVKVRLTHRSPLLAFCDAIMASVEATGAKPGSELSTECVECALNENRLDLLSHWISQDRSVKARNYHSQEQVYTLHVVIINQS